MSSHALPHDDDEEEVQLTDSRDVFDAVGARIAEAEESGRVVELDSDGEPSDDDESEDDGIDGSLTEFTWNFREVEFAGSKRLHRN